MAHPSSRRSEALAPLSTHRAAIGLAPAVQSRHVMAPDAADVDAMLKYHMGVEGIIAATRFSADGTKFHWVYHPDAFPETSPLAAAAVRNDYVKDSQGAAHHNSLPVDSTPEMLYHGTTVQALHDILVSRRMMSSCQLNAQMAGQITTIYDVHQPDGVYCFNDMRRSWDSMYNKGAMIHLMPTAICAPLRSQTVHTVPIGLMVRTTRGGTTADRREWIVHGDSVKIVSTTLNVASVVTWLQTRSHQRVLHETPRRFLGTDWSDAPARQQPRGMTGAYAAALHPSAARRPASPAPSTRPSVAPSRGRPRSPSRSPRRVRTARGSNGGRRRERTTATDRSGAESDSAERWGDWITGGRSSQPRHR